MTLAEKGGKMNLTGVTVCAQNAWGKTDQDRGRKRLREYYRSEREAIRRQNVTLILFTARAPDPLAEDFSRQGHHVYEAIAVSEVYALADQHPQAQIIITADIDPERAKAIQHHYPRVYLKANATVRDIVQELSQFTKDGAVQ